MANFWLLKSEADCYSLDDLKRDKTAQWTGVRNYQARNFLRDGMRNGDLCLFYHSGEGAHVAGVCRVTKDGYPDPTQFDPNDDHFDAESPADAPRWFGPDVAYARTFKHPVPLTDLRRNAKLAKMKLLEKGSRLSVLPVTAAEFAEVERMGG